MSFHPPTSRQADRVGFPFPFTFRQLWPMSLMAIFGDQWWSITSDFVAFFGPMNTRNQSTLLIRLPSWSWFSILIQQFTFAIFLIWLATKKFILICYLMLNQVWLWEILFWVWAKRAQTSCKPIQYIEKLLKMISKEILVFFFFFFVICYYYYYYYYFVV